MRSPCVEQMASSTAPTNCMLTFVWRSFSMLTPPRPTILAAFLMLAVVAATVVAEANEYKQGDLMINHPWARATPSDKRSTSSVWSCAVRR